jgi:hypothetical protein
VAPGRENQIPKIPNSKIPNSAREFVEQYEVQLSERGVGYLNTDVCSVGPILYPAASPTLGGLFQEAVKDVTR